MHIKHIIIQAGGKGTRLAYLTANKPKALVPVENLPMLFHMFRKFPDAFFTIIADYHKEVLHEYLECFAEVRYRIVDALGTGTCCGLKPSLQLLPADEPFMLVWSDLILSDTFSLPVSDGNYIGLSKTFECRYSYKEGAFYEEPSCEHGVAGLFVFENKSLLADIPESGEFVRWLKNQKISLLPLSLYGTKEFGTLSEYQKLEVEKCRPFNKLMISDGIVTKLPVDQQGKMLAQREGNWYAYAKDKNIRAIPRIYETAPIKMEQIMGKNIYELTELTDAERKTILTNLVGCIKELHQAGEIPADPFSLKEAYYKKTMDRLQRIRDLVPFASKPSIVVNGRECRNVFYYKRDFERLLDAVPCAAFHFIHGDCTFSNIMLRENHEPVLIDPRGYFGTTELFGDAAYDWAKLYYSLAGNYDKFNLKDFRLSISEEEICLQIASSHWEGMEQEFFALTDADPHVVKLIHAVIWLSLTTYAWQDYDSICGAFYNGLYYLEEVFHD